LVEVSKKQQARHCLKGGSEGGMPPAAADSSSSSSVQKVQPLQPLKQLQDIRRRGQQMRAGEDTSRDCQVRMWAQWYQMLTGLAADAALCAAHASTAA
jgi:hypothetical protein